MSKSLARMMRFSVNIFLLISAALLTSVAFGHDIRGTVIYIDLTPEKVKLELEIPVNELRSAFDVETVPGSSELPSSIDKVVAYAQERIILTNASGLPFTLTFKPGNLMAHDALYWQHISLEATPPPGSSTRDFILHTDLITHRVRSHHIFLFLRQDFETGVLEQPLYLDNLHYQHQETHVQRDRGSLWKGFQSIFKLGLSHIAEGSDHLLFLFTLLLPACLTLASRFRWGSRQLGRKTAWQIASIVTAFTLGHSLTLILGAFGLVQIPSQIVETLIAASILFSAIHILLPLFPHKETWVAGGFGLIHGLGFASAVQASGLEGSHLFLTVFGFNLGVEAMQIALVAIILPWIYVVQAGPFAKLFRVTTGLVALVIAGAWLIERAFGHESSLSRLVNRLTSTDFSPKLYLILVLLAGVSFVLQQRQRRTKSIYVN